MTMTQAERDGVARLLPWATPDGKPCFLISDRPDGFLSRRADDVERVQLALGAELLERVGELLDDPTASAQELRFAARTLVHTLRDALRVAESRGARLGTVGESDDADHEQVSSA